MAARVPLAALTVNNSNINPNPNSAWEAGCFFLHPPFDNYWLSLVSRLQLVTFWI